ncbi:MAG: hypothetical protein AB8C95_13415 [Phycisphaeraceae bacterium]
MAKDAMLNHSPCPFVEQGDGRCSCRMTKQTLAQAFEFCLGGRHFSCQTYHAIKWERQAQSDDSTTKLQPGTTAPITSQPYRHPSTPAARLGHRDDQQAVA